MVYIYILHYYIYIFQVIHLLPYLFVVIQLAPGSRQSMHPLGSPIKLKGEHASSEPNAKRHAGGFYFHCKKMLFYPNFCDI